MAEAPLERLLATKEVVVVCGPGHTSGQLVEETERAMRCPGAKRWAMSSISTVTRYGLPGSSGSVRSMAARRVRLRTP